MPELTPQQEKLCDESPYDYSGLKAVFVNCTLKPSPEKSHTEGLMDVSRAIMEKNGVETMTIRLVDHDVAYGVYPDMREMDTGGTPGPIYGRQSLQPTFSSSVRRFGSDRCRPPRNS